MGDREAILFANEAFYRAFADRDVEAMEGVWADEAKVTCIHPGWGLLEGRDQVMQSWLAILSNPQAPNITCLGAQAFVLGEVGYVVCFEKIDDTVLIATNTFVHEGRRWRLVHHQGGPTSDAPPEEDESPRGTVN